MPKKVNVEIMQTTLILSLQTHNIVKFGGIYIETIDSINIWAISNCISALGAAK